MPCAEYSNADASYYQQYGQDGYETAGFLETASYGYQEARLQPMTLSMQGSSNPARQAYGSCSEMDTSSTHSWLDF